MCNVEWKKYKLEESLKAVVSMDELPREKAISDLGIRMLSYTLHSPLRRFYKEFYWSVYHLMDFSSMKSK